MERKQYPTAHRNFANHLSIAIAVAVIALGLIGLSEVTVPVASAQGRSEKRVNPQAPSGFSDDATALLARAREKIAATTHRLPKCTCLETIERTYYVGKVEKIGPRAMTEAPANSCGGKEFGRRGSLTLSAKDRLRFQVAVVGGAEIDSWAAASRFDSRSVFELVTAGPISTGSFGTYLADIFENPGSRIRFTGAKNETSGKVFEYTFEVPVDVSHYGVGVENGWKVVGFHGWFQIYTATAELAQLVRETEELPGDARACRFKTTTDYHYLLIGREEFLLPRQSELETLSADANETSSIITFSGCHEYTAESTLRFDGQQSDDRKSFQAENLKSHTAGPLPPGLSLTLSLVNRVDGSAAAGDAISARVSKTVRAPGSNHVLVRAGAIAHGRILQLRRQYVPSQFLISMRFDTLETDGSVVPLSLKFDRLNIQMVPFQAPNGFRSRGSEFSLPHPASGESGSIFSVPVIVGRSILPAGFQSQWITLSQ